MAFNNIRNYLQEKAVRLAFEWKLFQLQDQDPDATQEAYKHADFKRVYHGARSKLTEQQKKQALQSEYDRIKQALELKNLEKKEPFEYFRSIYESEVRVDRLPALGIKQLPLMYHAGRTTTADERVPETGHDLHPLVKHLLMHKYPQYLHIPTEYCRPLGTTDATFKDFNKDQKASHPVPKYRCERILRHVTRILGAKKFMPLHFVDTQYAGLPLSTGTGYHNRHSFKIRAHAKYSHPPEYENMPTKKGYYINATLENARTLVHYIKYTGIPYDVPKTPDLEDGNPTDYPDMMDNFFNEYPTLLFTRNHISKRTGPLKQRPVYAVDDIFLLIEVMLTFCLHVQARRMDCAIMYSLETIRGGNVYLDRMAQLYKSYFTIDWSSFDQSVPRVITDTFFTEFLPRLLITSHGYHPTYEYPTHMSLDPDKFPYMMKNLLQFLHLWFDNMTFVTADGYSYRRTVAGIPSGMLNTQYLDSYCNLFVMVDAMIEYGFSDQEIEDTKIYVMGDDNSAFTNWPLHRTEQFVDFISVYAHDRWNMNLSRTKCIVTDLRQNIETLSYRCNFGRPTRNLDKLIAQLCYPEHGVNQKYMSARAIGIAYAACGCDATFHEFCKDMYHTFLPYAEPLTPEMKATFSKYLPGQFKLLDNPTFFLDLEHFPSIDDIHEQVHKWHGELLDTPKWNVSHFINKCDYAPPDCKTMYEYFVNTNE